MSAILVRIYTNNSSIVVYLQQGVTSVIYNIVNILLFRWSYVSFSRERNYVDVFL